jgi:hypothetical protein
MGGAATFNTLLNYLEETVETFVDDRQGSNKQYRIREAVFAAFSVFFTQSPSFLAFQTLMKKNKGINNARTLFGLEKIPSDNQIRNLLDPTPAEILSPFFLNVFSYLEGKKGLDSYRSINNSLLVILDGTGYFYS